MPGPAPKPDNVRKLHGTKRKAPVRPKAVVAVPDKPSELKGEALREWNRITPELERMGLLAKVDRGCLLIYVSAYGIWWDAARSIVAEGSVSEDKNHQPRKHPLWQVYRDASQTMLAAGKELGLTPSSRGRMTIPKQEDGARDVVLD